MTGAILDSCQFAGLSALGLNYQSCTSMHDATYQSITRLCDMSVPPVVVMGLNEPMAVFDHDIMIGSTLFSTASSIWLRDSSDAATHPRSEIAPDLHKSLSLLQRLKSTYADRQTVARLKSTKS